MKKYILTLIGFILAPGVCFAASITVNQTQYGYAPNLEDDTYTNTCSVTTTANQTYQLNGAIVVQDRYDGPPYGYELARAQFQYDLSTLPLDAVVDSGSIVLRGTSITAGNNSYITFAGSTTNWSFDDTDYDSSLYTPMITDPIQLSSVSVPVFQPFLLNDDGKAYMQAHAGGDVFVGAYLSDVTGASCSLDPTSANVWYTEAYNTPLTIYYHIPGSSSSSEESSSVSSMESSSVSSSVSSSSSSESSSAASSSSTCASCNGGCSQNDLNCSTNSGALISASTGSQIIYHTYCADYANLERQECSHWVPDGSDGYTCSGTQDVGFHVCDVWDTAIEIPALHFLERIIKNPIYYAVEMIFGLFLLSAISFLPLRWIWVRWKQRRPYEK